MKTLVSARMCFAFVEGISLAVGKGHVAVKG